MKKKQARKLTNNYIKPTTVAGILKEIKLLAKLGMSNFNMITTDKLADKAMTYFADELGYNVTIWYTNSEGTELEITW